MPKVAILDDRNRLLGVRTVEEPAEGDLVVDDGIDLPTNGTYKWVPDQESFVPLGHGFGPVSARPPISEARVLYLIVKHLGRDAARELRDWAVWYEDNLKVRDEERESARRRR